MELMAAVIVISCLRFLSLLKKTSRHKHAKVCTNDFYLLDNTTAQWPPFPQIDNIGAVVFVWRVRGKIIRSVLCNIVCNNCAQCNAHTYEQT